MVEEQQLSLLKGYLYKLIPGLKDETWQAFAAKQVVKQYAKGEVYIKPGMVCNSVSYINSGLLRSYFLLDGKEFTSSFIDKDCYFSDYESFLTRKPTVLYTEAIEPTEVIDISYKDLQYMYSNYPECERVGRLIAEELFVHLSDRSSSFLLDSPEQRYVKFLQEYETVVQRIPQYMIASYLGITPEALSRIRSRLSRKGNTVHSRVIDQDQ